MRRGERLGFTAEAGPMTTHGRKLLQVFVTGLLAALPLAATLFIFVWAARFVYDLVGPSSFVGRGLKALGLGVTGSEIAGYAIGVGIVLAAIFALGVAIQTRLKHVWHDVVDSVIQRVPVVRNVYDVIRKFVDLISKRDKDGVNSMSPVWLQFGGDGPAVLGLLSTPQPVLVGGKPFVAVLVPTAPVPVGGGLIFVPQDWVRPAEIGVEGLTSIYVSMGVTSGQHLPVAAVPPIVGRIGPTTPAPDVRPTAPAPPAAP
jgi:uncharacterized membrane protein